MKNIPDIPAVPVFWTALEILRGVISLHAAGIALRHGSTRKFVENS